MQIYLVKYTKFIELLLLTCHLSYYAKHPSSIVLKCVASHKQSISSSRLTILYSGSPLSLKLFINSTAVSHFSNT